MKTKLGRNDLCSCGSGKKYKKCCMALESISDPGESLFNRYNNMLTMTKLRLDEAYSPQIKKVRNEAKRLFLRFTTEQTLALEYESFFSDWLWFDQIDSEENTLGFHYLQVQGQYMDPSLRTCLSALTLSYISVYETLGIEGEFLRVKDIFSRTEVKVLLKEPFTSPHSLLILGRLVHMPEASIFSGTVFSMENEDNCKEFLIAHFNYIKSLSTDTLLDLFKFNGNMIFGLFEHAYKKVMVNINDIKSAPLDNNSRQLLLSSLQSNDNFAMQYELEDYIYFKPLDSDKGYVRIAIGLDHVVLCADVLEDIDNLKGTIQALLPELNFTVINSIFLNEPPPLDKAAIWFSIIKDQESERWFNSPVDELDGQTPAHILATDNGHKCLLERLDILAATVDTDEQKEFINYLKQKTEILKGALK